VEPESEGFLGTMEPFVYNTTTCDRESLLVENNESSDRENLLRKQLTL
jgi:hypothetical protein